MLKKITNKWWFWALIIGVAIRLVLMPITYHPDLLGHSIAGYFLAYKGVPNIYDYLYNLPSTDSLARNIGVTNIFIYPPLTYYTLGLFRFIVKPFADPNFVPWMWTHMSSLYSYPSFGWQIFLFKFPYLFVDTACAFILAGLFDDIKKKKAAFILWMFNPVTIYATFMMGQIDILPVFFTLLACILVKRKRFGWALFSLGVGAAYKTYPLLLIPPAAFLLGETFWKRIKLILVGLLPYVLAIAPYLGSKGFRSMVLFGSKETKMLFMSWPVTGAEGIFPFILILMIIYLISYYSKKKINIESYFLSIILLIFLVSSYHPQWFLWVAPFLIWAMVTKSYKYFEIVIVLFVSWLIITLFFEPSLSWGLFGPISPFLAKAPGLTDILTKYADVNQLKSIIRSVFAGASIYYIYFLFSENKATHDTI